MGLLEEEEIERQAAADALGISVEEMGKFVLLNQAAIRYFYTSMPPPRQVSLKNK
jgi:hypothetical protein